MKRLLKPALGLLLLAGLLALVDTEALWAALKAADWGLFGLAVVVATLANGLSAYRWWLVSRALGLVAPLSTLVRAYWQGIALNSLLPGGIVGGDAWRCAMLARAQRDAVQLKAVEGAAEGAPDSAASPLGRAAGSVFIERSSGLWGLGVVSAIFLGLALTVPAAGAPEPEAWLLTPYLLGLVALVLGPALGLPLLSRVGRLSRPRWLARGIERLPPALFAQSRLLWRTLPLSILMQAITVGAFLLCLQAVGADLSSDGMALWIGGMAAGIFLSLIVPASLGGFGAREAATLALLQFLPLPSAVLLAGSILFGLTATLQGALGALTLVWATPPQHPPAPSESPHD